MHQPASHCNATVTSVCYHCHWFWLPASYASSFFLLQMSRDPVGHHWFWLPASYASSLFLLQMFTGPMPQVHFQSGAFSSSSSSSSLPGSMQEHVRFTSQCPQCPTALKGLMQEHMKCTSQPAAESLTHAVARR